MSTRYNRCRYSNYQSDDNSENTVDDHVHEFEGSTMFAEECDDKHNHRFAGVTGEAIKYGKSQILQRVSSDSNTFVDFITSKFNLVVDSIFILIFSSQKTMKV